MEQNRSSTRNSSKQAAAVKKEDDPLSAVIDYWLRGNVTKPAVHISWEIIVSTLKSEYVGEQGLAQKVQNKYCHSQDTQAKNDTDHQSSQFHVTGGHVEGLVSAGPPLLKSDIKRETCSGEQATATFEVAACIESLNSISAFLLHEQTSTSIACSLEKTDSDMIKISYQPFTPGNFKLHFMVQGQHVKGSPFPIVVKPPPPTVFCRVKKPDEIVVNKNGEVIVTSWDDNNCVVIFSPSGERLLSFGTRGSGTGQFNCPSGVAVDSEGSILVVDTENHRLQKFTARGAFLTTVGQEGKKPLQFKRPHNIAFNPSNEKFYVSDKSNNRIQILNSDLSYYSSFGKRGSDKGHFNNPRKVAFDSSGNVYVADRENIRIQVFTAEGGFLHMFGGAGESCGDLNRPHGLDQQQSVHQ